MVIRGRLGPARHAYADLILLDRSGDKLAPFEPRVVAPCRRPGHLRACAPGPPNSATISLTDWCTKVGFERVDILRRVGQEFRPAGRAVRAAAHEYTLACVGVSGGVGEVRPSGSGYGRAASPAAAACRSSRNC